MPRERVPPVIPVTRQPMRLEALRALLSSWSTDRLVNLVMDLVASDWELHRRIDRLVVGAADPEEAARSLEVAMHHALAVHSVEWDQVDAFVSKLDCIVGDIAAFGRDEPRRAIQLLLAFVAALPRVFEAVHGEDELSSVCEDLATKAVSLATRVDAPMSDTVEPLLRAFLDDGYGYFDRVPGTLAGLLAKLPISARRELAASVLRIAGDAKNTRGAETLEGLAGHLDPGQGPPRRRSPKA